MVNIGDKFIIELAVECPNSNNDRYFILKNTKGMQVMVKESTLDGFEKWDEQSAIKQLEEFSKGVSDDIEDAYQRGLHDAWEAARKIIAIPMDGGLTTGEIDDIFGEASTVIVIGKFTAEQAIEKLAAYEGKKKAEEIKVGDEVCAKDGFCKTKLIVVRLDPYEPLFSGVDCKGCTYANQEVCDFTKTGRHFPQVAELLAAMEEDGETNV